VAALGFLLSAFVLRAPDRRDGSSADARGARRAS
jgi:hypothetical protein